MQYAAAAVLIISAIFTTGCGSQWVRLDNRPITLAEFQNARLVCRVDEKEAQIVQAEAERNARLSSSRTNEATMLAKDDFSLKVNAVYAEIDECMQQQGYKKE